MPAVNARSRLRSLSHRHPCASLPVARVEASSFTDQAASTRSAGLSACAGIFSLQPLATCQRSERRRPSGVRSVPPLATNLGRRS